jgi:hypothetical protein
VTDVTRPTALTPAETAALWAVDFDPDTVSDAHFCRWQRKAACEQVATSIVHCALCGGARLELCAPHSGVILTELSYVAQRPGGYATCGDCQANGRPFDIYVIHPIGAC